MALISGVNAARYSTYISEQFTGTGSQVTFTLSKTPISSASLIVTVDGVKQLSNSYTVGGNQIVFSEAPPSGSSIEVVALGLQGVANVPVDGSVGPAKLDAATGSGTGAMSVPNGTTAQRPSPTSGMIRFNSSTQTFEGYNGSSWGAIGGGALGSGGNYIFYENDTVVTQNYTITTGKNAITAGPVTIADGVVVTIPDGSSWSIT
jgi:hypothetical protein